MNIVPLHTASVKLQYHGVLALSIGLVAYAFFGMTGFAFAQDRIYAIYDPVCDLMVAEPPVPSELVAEEKSPYFDAPIARRIFLQDLCEQSQASKRWRAAWAKYAEKFGYTLESIPSEPTSSWDANLNERQNFGGPLVTHQRFCELAQKKRGWRLLHQHGGMLVDLNIGPPVHEGAPVDLSRLMPLRGLVALAAAKPQNIRHFMGGLTVSDAIVLASAGHPVITALVQQLQDNEESLKQIQHDVNEAYKVGHVYLSRIVSGALTVLPRHFLTQFAMVPEDADALLVP